MAKIPALPLTPAQKQVRALGILAILGFLAYAFILNPTGSPSNWSFSGFRNVTGLPCPLCGGTRATHYLLRGNFSQTLYYNWLAIPAFLVASTLVITMTLELVQNRSHLPTFRLNPPILIISALILAVVWIFHVHGALSSPKPELLNSQGLYFKLKPEDTPPKP